MLALEVGAGRGRGALEVLCLGAHCDDIDIGCGGSLLELLGRYPRVNVTWVVFSSTPERERELRRSAARFLGKAARSQVIAHRFRDGFFPADFAAIKESFETLKKLPAPDVVFTHFRADRHQDHRVIAELTWNTFRNHLILEYEIAKYEGDLGTPTAYFAFDKTVAERKIRILMSTYRSQLAKAWFTEDTFRGLMRIRGIESGSALGWAEGFHAAKVLLA